MHRSSKLALPEDERDGEEISGESVQNQFALNLLQSGVDDPHGHTTPSRFAHFTFVYRRAPLYDRKSTERKVAPRFKNALRL